MFFLLSHSRCNETSSCGYCVRTSTFSTRGVSPAFDLWKADAYDFSNATYPAWAESVWKSVNGRIFLQASPNLEWGVFVLGLAVTVASFALVYMATKTAAEVFVGEGASGRGASTSTQSTEPTAL